MRRFQAFWLVFTALVTAGVARAQDVRITFPTEGQTVRGQISAQFEGIPAGGYANIKIDDKFVGATSQNSYVFDTISDRTIFAKGDGTYKLTITGMNQGGKLLMNGTTSVNFKVGNNIPETSGESVRLVHWTPSDRLSTNVQRYRIFAESSSNVEAAAGASSGGDGGIEWIEAPLDWQISALVRRVVRDVDMYDHSANVRSIVQDAFERQRKAPDAEREATAASITSAATGTAPPKKKKKKASSGTGAAIKMKAPWDELWTKSTETGQYFVKMIQQNGTEFNAVRKPPPIALGDLLPEFPNDPVRPGSTWETRMSVLGELSSRTPIDVRDVRITFTAFETLQTPNQDVRRCAKLECRFQLPETLSKKIAVGLETNAGRAAGQATGTEGGGSPARSTGGTGGGGEGATELTEDDIEIARTNVSRVLWFDIERNLVLRSEDSVRTFYQLAQEGDAGGAAAAEPKKVSYNLNVTTWLDDREPVNQNLYNAGVGTAHGRDNVSDFTLDDAKTLKPRTR